MYHSHLKELTEEITFTTRSLSKNFLNESDEIKNPQIFERRIKKLKELTEEVLEIINSKKSKNSITREETVPSNDSSFCDIESEDEGEGSSEFNFLDLNIPKPKQEVISSQKTEVRIMRFSESLKNMEASNQSTVISHGPEDTLLFCNEKITIMKGNTVKFQYKSHLTSCFTDAVYVDQDYYICLKDEGILRKSLSDTSFCFFQSVYCNSQPGRALKPAFSKQAIIYQKKQVKTYVEKSRMRRIKNRGPLIISIPNLILGCMIEKKTVNYLCHCDGAAADFHTYGQNHGKLSIVSSDGWLMAYDLGRLRTAKREALPVMFITKKRLSMYPKHTKKLRRLDAEYREFDYTMAVCPNGKFFAVHSKSLETSQACLEIFELVCGSFVLKDSIVYGYKDSYNLSLTCLKFYGYLDEKLILCGLSGGFNQKMMSYVYDLNIGKVEKLDIFTVSNNCLFGNCCKMIKTRDNLSFCDGKGNINHVKFNKRKAGGEDWMFVKSDSESSSIFG